MNATERANEFLQIWLNVEVFIVEKDFVEFCVKNLKCDFSFKDVNRSVISTLTDSLLKKNFDLQQFLRIDKTMKKLSIHALSDAFDSTIMNYDRAFQKFDVSNESENDIWRQKSESNAKFSIENSIAQISIAEKATSTSMFEIKIEKKFRQQRNWCFPIASLLSSDEQWVLFDSFKYLKYTIILARQYYKLIVEKQAKKTQKSKKSKKIVKNEQFDENSTIDSVVSNVALNSEEWSLVDQFDFEKFTSWISRCKETISFFSKTIFRSWKTDRNARQKSLVDKLKRWEFFSNFDYESSKHSNSKHYYKESSFFEKNLKILNIKTTMTIFKR